MSRIAALLSSTLLIGCSLVDQRTFNPQAGLPPRAPAAPGPGPARPLVTINLGTSSLDYADALHQAVGEALARKPDVTFDVVSMVPATGTPAQQVQAAAGITADARAVARAINADGVDDSRIHLSARADPGVSSRQIQVFVQ